jgi:transcriptional regulator with XRE-family HTH domain
MSTQPHEVYTPALPQYARLHLARFMAGLEMQELADRMDISRGTVSNYEDADYSRQRQRSTIRLWALATGYPFDWLADGVPSSPDGESVKHRGYGHDAGSEAIVHDAAHRFRSRAA